MATLKCKTGTGQNHVSVLSMLHGKGQCSSGLYIPREQAHMSSCQDVFLVEYYCFSVACQNSWQATTHYTPSSSPENRPSALLLLMSLSFLGLSLFAVLYFLTPSVPLPGHGGPSTEILFLTLVQIIRVSLSSSIQY